jgi:long-subunit acyl-CoA synthetase (AMP-forming)
MYLAFFIAVVATSITTSVIWSLSKNKKPKVIVSPPPLYEQRYQGRYEDIFEQLVIDLHSFANQLDYWQRCDAKIIMRIEDFHSKSRMADRGWTWQKQKEGGDLQDSFKFENVVLKKFINGLQNSLDMGSFKAAKLYNLNVVLIIRCEFKDQKPKEQLEKEVDEIMTRMEVDKAFSDEMKKRGFFQTA